MVVLSLMDVIKVKMLSETSEKQYYKLFKSSIPSHGHLSTFEFLKTINPFKMWSFYLTLSKMWSIEIGNSNLITKPEKDVFHYL